MKKAALLLAALMAVSAVGCSSKEEEQEIVVPIFEADKIDYKTEEAVIGDISQKYYVDGGFDYPYYEKVSFKMGGIIDSIAVEEGQSVEKGDVLCTLNSDDLSEQLEQKKVYLDQAQKTVNTLTAEGIGGNELEMAKTQLELLQLEYDHLAASESDYNVYAPCSGVFMADRGTSFDNDINGQRGAENLIIIGGQVKASQSFGRISDHSQRYLVAPVYDNPLENVNFGTRVSLEQGRTEAQGRVIDIVEEEAGGMKLYNYVIEPDEDSDLGDMQVNCIFDVYSKLDTVIVPTKAIKKTKDRTYVNLLIDGTKIEQDVEVGIEDGDRTEILSGLAGGEQIIINNA